MIFTAVIIEDEIPARDTLKGYISRYFENIKIIGELDTVEESILFLNKNEVQIIFLDVQLKDGKGIDILREINTSNYKIIFTTAFDEYALEAFKHKSFGYLLKPLDPDDFKEIVGRVIKDLSFEEEKKSKKIKVSIPSGFKWIEVEDIIRCESENNYTKIIVNKEKHTFLISKTLKSVELEIINSNKFLRVHQSHLINKDHIANAKMQHNTIIMTNGDKIPVSRSNRKNLLD